MLQVWRKLMDMLDARERRRFRLLLAMIVVMGFANMGGVAVIIPFLSILAKPELVETNAILAGVYQGLGFQSRQDFLLAMGVMVFVVFIGSVMIRIVTAWALFRFGSMRNYSISTRLLRGYLGQPYAWSLGRHSADLVKTVMGETAVLVNGVVIPLLEVISNAVVVLAMVSLMVLANPLASLIMATIVGGSYVLIFVVARRMLLRIGQQRFDANRACHRIAQESMIGIKEIKVLGLEAEALGRYRVPALRLVEAQAASRTLSEVPRHLLEGIAFGSMILVLVVLLAMENGDLSAVLPVAGVFALAGARLMPAMQAIYRGVSTIRFNKPTLDSLHREVLEADGQTLPPATPPEPLHLRERLALRDVTYAYPASERTALQGISLEIRANSTVGIVGGTGAGKTTAMDILLGLLPPQGGALEVDGVAVEGEDMQRAWRRSIGYVPQQIFLTDATVSENVAFGIAPEDIDHDAVERAARMAELHDFVTGELPQGYKTMVGDRGVRLSGGQRQRIGIARALYHDPDVLILDEATSALDNITERAVIDAVARLGGNKTIIMVAHRLTTVRNCDEIFLLAGGEVAASGTYDELIERSEVFREMAQGGS